MTEADLTLDQAAIAKGGYVLFQPWKYPRLTLRCAPVETLEELDALRMPGTYRARLQPIEDETYLNILTTDKPIFERVAAMPKGAEIPWEDRTFFSCSWCPRAPQRMKLHTRRQVLGQNAFTWSMAEASMREKSGKRPRLFFVLTLLDQDPDAAELPW